MSAFLSSNDAISALVTYWEMSASRHGTYTTPRKSLHRAFMLAGQAAGEDWLFGIKDQAAEASVKGLLAANSGSFELAVFALLLDANVESLKARYPYSPDMWSEAADYAYKRSPSVWQWLNRAPLGHGNLVGIARGFDYQACEFDGWPNSAAFQIIKQIETFLLADLGRQGSPDSENWADFKEPADIEPAPISLMSMINKR